ncbi:MAG: IS1 family transposase [Anaerolineae bacterium]|nr:IS1 family transposase [Anaerolineae bacterium]
MNQFAQVGDYCPNESCIDYGKLQAEVTAPNICKFGKTKNGTQRYQCKSCRQTFTATKGTIFYRRRIPMEEILEAIAMIAEGMRISSVARVKGHKEDTIGDWLQEAGQHAEKVESLLLANYQVERGQLDGLWSYVGNKGAKKLFRNG